MIKVLVYVMIRKSREELIKEYDLIKKVDEFEFEGKKIEIWLMGRKYGIQCPYCGYVIWERCILVSWEITDVDECINTMTRFYIKMKCPKCGNEFYYTPSYVCPYANTIGGGASSSSLKALFSIDTIPYAAWLWLLNQLGLTELTKEIKYPQTCFEK